MKREQFVQQILQRVRRTVKCPSTTEVAVIFVNDQKMRQLNRKYRDKDKTTNVLAFEGGDIFISIPEAQREAKKYNWTLNYEIARLTVHGFLHLLGYDHEKAKEARKMEQLENKILSRV